MHESVAQKRLKYEIIFARKKQNSVRLRTEVILFSGTNLASTLRRSQSWSVYYKIIAKIYFNK